MLYMKTIQLSKGLFAIVDDEDFERISRFKWSATKSDGKWYARRNHSGSTVYLHRFILGITTRQYIDHINGNSLDNRRANLRIATNSQNGANTKKRTTNTSGYKGVKKAGRKWRATITCNYREVHIGVYETPEDAARAYDSKARELFGNFAGLNFTLPGGY